MIYINLADGTFAKDDIVVGVNKVPTPGEIRRLTFYPIPGGINYEGDAVLVPCRLLSTVGGGKGFKTSPRFKEAFLNDSPYNPLFSGYVGKVVLHGPEHEVHAQNPEEVKTSPETAFSHQFERCNLPSYIDGRMYYDYSGHELPGYSRNRYWEFFLRIASETIEVTEKKTTWTRFKKIVRFFKAEKYERLDEEFFLEFMAECRGFMRYDSHLLTPKGEMIFSQDIYHALGMVVVQDDTVVTTVGKDFDTVPTVEEHKRGDIIFIP